MSIIEEQFKLLEKENINMKNTINQLRKENDKLRKRLFDTKNQENYNREPMKDDWEGLARLMAERGKNHNIW